MKIAITAETTIDLSKELLKQYDIHTVPLTVLLDDKMVLDGEVSNEEMFKFVEEKNMLPKTSAVNEEQYTKFFTEILKDYEAIIHISLSSELSSACNNAKAASEKFDNVYVIDSRTLSTGIALEAIYANKLVKLGLKPEDIVSKVEAKIPFVQASFVLKKLNYLYKGGRCSALSFFGANILGIKPQIIVKNGKMDPYHKYRGPMEKVVREYCADTLKEFNTPDLDVAFLTYTSATEGMIMEAEEALKKAGFKNIYKTTAGSTISSHCGENSLGILYINSNN
ncbi:MAG: DegV family protein [Clostridiales bacterium]|nr:DegV family protein [Candidatus Apopatousia equi]